MTVRLTETAIAKAVRDIAAAGGRRDLADAGCPGLRLRLTAAGGKSWVLACRDREGRMRRFALGAHGDKDGQMGVAAARDAARALHVRVKHDGADPVADRRRARAIGRDAKAGVGTLAALVALYEKQVGSKQKRWAECRRRIEMIFEPQLNRPLATMRASDLQMAADAWPSQTSAAAGVRYLRPILKWAAPPRGYVSADLAAIRPLVGARRRERVLSPEELAALLPVLAASNRPHAAAMKLMLLTLARREEVAAAT